MNSFKLGLATMLLATATVSLATAGNPNTLIGSPRALQARPSVSSGINTDQDLVHVPLTPVSPKAQAFAADFRRASAPAMNCCSAVVAKTSKISPRAASLLPAQGVSPVGVKCSMGQQSTGGTGCCAPKPTRKATCCG